MFDFTRAYKAIDDSLAEAVKQLTTQTKKLELLTRYSMGDEVLAKIIKLQELINDLNETKRRMQNVNTDIAKLLSYCTLPLKEFTLRAIVHSEDILSDSRVIEFLNDEMDQDTATQIVDTIMDDYPVNTGIRWILPFL